MIPTPDALFGDTLILGNLQDARLGLYSLYAALHPSKSL